MIKPVIKQGNPLLNKRSQEVTDIAAVESVIKDLWDTLAAIQQLYPFKRGCGIAAPQIGQLWRLNAVKFDGKKYTLINPKIVDHTQSKAPVREGCLSFFDYRGMALRYTGVTVNATGPDGKPFTIRAEGDFAMLLQHEIDHLDGKLYDSRLAPGEKLYRVEMPHIP